MNEPRQFNDTNIKRQCKIIWSAMQSSAPMFLVTVYILETLSILDPILPDLRNILLGLAALSVAAPFLLLGHFKRQQNTVRDNLKLGIDNEASQLQRYFTFMLIGISLCNLSSMFGIVLYIVAGDYFYSLFFIAVSFFLGFLYKPDLS